MSLPVPPRIVPDDLRLSMNPQSRFLAHSSNTNVPMIYPPDPQVIAPPHPPPFPLNRSQSFTHDASGLTTNAKLNMLSLNYGQGDLVEELRQARREVELLKSMKDPFRAADLAVEMQVEKMKVVEATSARDSAVQRLASAYDSIKQKTQLANRLHTEKEELERARLSEMGTWTQRERAWAEERHAMEVEIRRLIGVIEHMKGDGDPVVAKSVIGSERGVSIDPRTMQRWGSVTPVSPTPSVSRTDDTEKTLDVVTNDIDHLAITRPSSALLNIPSSRSSPAYRLPEFSPFMHSSADRDFRVAPSPQSPAEMAKARYAVLAALPIPGGVPDDALTPIMIPPPFTLYEFLGNATDSLRHALAGYRAFQENATQWCPEREEHGYFLTPLYKCNTNPRAISAHQWTEVDPKGRMTKPTECFYHNEGKWYYAGQYIALRLEDLMPKEWEALDSDTSASLIKETLSGRKNTSPQTHYETSQLYACGALRIACVGLQCVGFNTALYRAITEQANKCQQSGRWRTGWPAPISDASPYVSGMPGGNVNMNPIVGGPLTSGFV